MKEYDYLPFRKMICEKAGLMMQAYGFTSFKQSQDGVNIYKPDSNCLYDFYFRVLNGGYSCYISSIGIQLTFPEVEKIYKKIFKKGRTTIVTGYQHRLGMSSGSSIYDISSFENIEKTVEKLSDIYREYFEPWAGLYGSSLEKLNELINQDPQKLHKDNSMQYSNNDLPTLGLIIAKLSNDPNYDTLKMLYRENLLIYAPNRDDYLEDCDKVIAYLDAM